jgi:hypothetical protein
VLEEGWAQSINRKLLLSNRIAVRLISLLIVGVLIGCLPASVAALGIKSRSIQLFNNEPSATTTYKISFTIVTPDTMGSLDVLFCANSPISGDTCDVPLGLDISNAVLSSQTGLTDFSSFPVSSNELLLSRTSSTITPPLPVTLTFNNMVNPSSIGPYYVRLAAYATTNGTGPSVDFGGLAFAITNELEINSYVPPYLTFCAGVVISTYNCSTASGDYINFGELNPSHSSQADSQLLIATNAGNGYVIQIYGTTMTAGNAIIPALSSLDSSKPGTSQFGLNLTANSVPTIGAAPDGPGSGLPTLGYNQSNKFQFVSNDVIANSSNTEDYRRYTVSYLVNVSKSQPPGIYVSTVTYVAAGSF